MASYIWFMIYTTIQGASECSKMSDLNDFIYWTQTDSNAKAIANRYNLVLPLSTNEELNSL